MTEIKIAKKNNNEIVQKESPMNRMNLYTNNKSVKKLFQNSLGKNSDTFIVSLLDLYSDPQGTLKECEPHKVVQEALKAATLQLPINKNLGFAYIIPYKTKKLVDIKDEKGKVLRKEWKDVQVPQFQLGYKGLIQLAIRSGQYKTINASLIYEGMEVKENYLTGETEITGSPTSNEVIGYVGYFRLINGFEKTIYMTKNQIENHAEKFSQAYKNRYFEGKLNKNNVWVKNFDEMALKTVVKRLLSKYGILSTQMQTAIMNDNDIELKEEIKAEANKLELNIPDDDGVIEDVEFEELTPEQQKMVNEVPF